MSKYNQTLLKNQIGSTRGKAALEVELKGARKIAFLLFKFAGDFFLTAVDEILVVLGAQLLQQG